MFEGGIDMPDESIVKPIYQRIAIDIANRIANDDFFPGDKIHGRSTLASEYNVSPETIRRSIILLRDMDIVEVSQGSGIIVKSKDKAYHFIEKFKIIDSISSIKSDIMLLLDKRRKIEQELNESIDKLVSSSERFKNTNPFAPLEIKINDDAKVINKTISETKFWQETGATVIGIRRENKIILSPGPYAIFKPGDIVIVIGDENSYNRIMSLLYGSCNL